MHEFDGDESTAFLEVGHVASETRTPPASKGAGSTDEALKPLRGPRALSSFADVQV